MTLTSAALEQLALEALREALTNQDGAVRVAAARVILEDVDARRYSAGRRAVRRRAQDCPKVANTDTVDSFGLLLSVRTSRAMQAMVTSRGIDSLDSFVAGVSWADVFPNMTRKEAKELREQLAERGLSLSERTPPSEP